MNRRLLILIGMFVAMLILCFSLFGYEARKDAASIPIEEYAPGEDEYLGELALAAISEVLSGEGLGRLAMLMDSRSTAPYVEIILTDVEEISNEKIQQLQQLVTEAIYAETNKDFSITIRTKSDEERLDEEWQQIFSIVMSETEQNFEAYRGFAHSFVPAPLEIIIKTHLSHAELEKAKDIEKFVATLIEGKRQALSIEKIPYAIIIRDKNNKPFTE